jgi:predicted outer membrane protein
MLALGNVEEIQLGKFAQQKAQHPQVKEFAQQMVQDHTKQLQQLREYLPAGAWQEIQSQTQSAGQNAASQGSRSEPSAASQNRDSDQPRTGAAPATQDRDAPAGQARNNDATDSAIAAQPQAPGAGRQGQGPGQGPMMQIHKEAAQKCLQRTRDLLSESQGDEFDMAYIGQQIVGHIQMIAKLEASQDHVSPELQQVIRQGAQGAEQHLKQAQTIADEIKSGAKSSSSGARKSGQSGAQPERTERSNNQ